MKQLVTVVLASLFSALSIVFLTVTIYRLTLDYTEAGIHFDENSMTTYHDGAIIFYGLMSVVFVIPSLLLWISVRSKRSKS